MVRPPCHACTLDRAQLRRMFRRQAHARARRAQTRARGGASCPATSGTRSRPSGAGGRRALPPQSAAPPAQDLPGRLNIMHRVRLPCRCRRCMFESSSLTHGKARMHAGKLPTRSGSASASLRSVSATLNPKICLYALPQGAEPGGGALHPAPPGLWRHRARRRALRPAAFPGAALALVRRMRPRPALSLHALSKVQVLQWPPRVAGQDCCSPSADTRVGAAQ